MKKIVGIYLLMFFILWLASCKPADPQQGDTGNSVNSTALEKMQARICVNGEELVEVDFGSLQKAFQSITNYNAFSFVRGASRCALQENYGKDGGPTRQRLSVVLPDTCLVNGSLWTLKLSRIQGNRLYAELYEFGTSSDKTLRIEAENDVRLRDLTQTIGMRFYKCLEN